jgi:hypothetical protein
MGITFQSGFVQLLAFLPQLFLFALESQHV